MTKEAGYIPQLGEAIRLQKGRPTTRTLMAICIRDGSPGGIKLLLDNKEKQAIDRPILERAIVTANEVRKRHLTRLEPLFQSTPGIRRFFEKIPQDVREKLEELEAKGIKPYSDEEITELLKRDIS